MRQITEDPEKAHSLHRMAQKILERIHETDMERFPSQILTDYYDALHSFMEALAVLNGVKSSGEGAHKKLIDWAADHLSLDEQHRQLLHQMRKHRNRIKYEGFTIQAGYINRNKETIKQLAETLRTTVAGEFDD